jgi:hypothetical protein
MTWIKLDDKTPRHPKIAGLSNLGFRWWINALCFASEFLTDGVLPRVFYKRVPKQIRAELTDAGLWEFVDPNLVIHDYLEHQQSRESVENERRRQRDRRKSERGTPDRRTAGTTPGTNGGNTQPPNLTLDTDKKEDLKTQTHARANGHGRGANAPNALPRDHRFHAVCSPKWRVCLTEATAAKLAAIWGGDPNDTTQALERFVTVLEAQIGDGPKGDFLWLTQHFEAFMYAEHRVPVAAPKPAKAVNGQSINDQIDEWAKS